VHFHTLILWFSRIRWSICSKTSKHVTVHGRSDLEASAKLNRPVLKVCMKLLPSLWLIQFSTYWTFILQNASPCCSLVHCANKAAMLNLTQYYRYSRDSETQLGANERRFVLFVPVIFSVLPTSFLAYAKIFRTFLLSIVGLTNFDQGWRQSTLGE
jgi:hypothetical protein